MTARIRWDPSLCQKHGQCEIAAPDLFRLDLDGTLHVTTAIGADQLDDAWAAADACPEQAISIIEDEEHA